MNVIYALSDPCDNQVRYIGKTNNLKRRLAMHLRDKDVCHRTNWLKKLSAAGLKPTMTIVETLSDDQDWEERERYWIKYYRSLGCNLTNGTDGGDQGPDCTGKHLAKSASARQNIIAALVQRNKTPKMREIARRNGLRNKGRKESPERIEQKRQWMTGRQFHTDEFKRALAERNKARDYDSEEMRKKARQLWDDPIKGPEMRARLVERNKRKHQTTS